MNPKFKFALIRRYSDQGFAMPIVMGMGLIMLLIAATLIVRSHGDQMSAAAQKATTDSFYVAETGVTRVQSLLNRFPKMAEKPKSGWAAEYNRLSGINNCLRNDQDDNLITNINNWITLDSSNPNKGEIKILDYTYASGVGKLKIAGRARSENGSATSSVDNADSYLEVQIPVVPLNDFPVPGLWAKTFGMGNNKVHGNVLVFGCSTSVPGITQADNIVPGSGTLSANPSLEYPALPDLPAVCPSLITATTPPCYQVFKQNNTTYDPATTTADAITTSYVKSSVTSISECLKDTDGYVVKEDNQGNFDKVRVRGNYITSCTDSSHYNVSKGVAFPRANDKAGSDGVYRYLIGVNSGDSIELKGGNKIIITAGQKVIFYLQGNINMTGQAQIQHTGTPTNFQIFGSDGAGKYKHASDTTSSASYKTTSVMLSGNSSANMFIYAPEATVGVNGGGNATPSIRGSVWAKRWDASNANKIVIEQPTAWTDPFEKPKRIGSISSWQRSSN